MKERFKLNAKQLSALGTVFGVLALAVGKICDAISSKQIDMAIEERATEIVDERLTELGIIESEETDE